MKNIKNRIFLSILTGFVLLFNFSCKMNLLDPKSETYLSINLEDEARMVMPSVSAESLTNIKLYNESVADSNVLASWDNISSIGNTKIPMEVGDYTLILKATLGTTEVQDSKAITVVEGANELSFSLSASNSVIATNEGNGSVKITLSYEGSGEVTQGVFNIYGTNTTYSGSLKSSEDGKLIFTATNIPVGYYNFAVQAKVGNKYAAYSGAVYIAKNLTSVGDFTCKLTTGSLLKTIKVTIKDTYNNTTLEKYLCAGAKFNVRAITDDIYPVTRPERPGYIFSGFLNSNNEEIWFVPSEDCTLTVNWLEAKTVTFNTMGGTEIASVKVPLGRNFPIIEPNWATGYFYFDYDYNKVENGEDLALPTRAGYIFDGWYFDESYTRKASCSDWSIYFTVENDITLYAKWLEGAVISFNSNGGSAVSSITVEKGITVGIFNNNGDNIYIYKIVGDSTYYITDFAIPTKTGFMFEGWYSDEGCDTSVMEWNNRFVVPDDGITLYAKWREACSLTFYNGSTIIETVYVPKNANVYINNLSPEQSGRDVPITGIYGGNFGSITYGTFATPTVDGKLFAGWYSDEGCTTAINTNGSIEITGNMNIYAKFADPCTISFDTVGGSTPESIVVPQGSSVRVGKDSSVQCYLSYNGNYKYFSAPTKADCVFGGFYQDSSYSQSASSTFTVNSDTVIYVKWIAGVTITFNSKGGSAVDSVVIPSGATIRYIREESDNYSDSNPIYNTYVNYSVSGSWESLRTQLPTRTGYIFGGWYTNEACTQPTYSNNGYLNLTVTNNLTVYAKWIEGAELRIMNGDSLYQTVDLTKNEELMYMYYYQTSGGQTMSGWKIGSQTKWGEVEAPTNGNMVPEGLYEDAACTQRLPAYPETFTITEASKTVYIKWVDPCNVLINLNGSVLSFNVPAGNSYNLYLGPGDNSQYYVTLSNLQTYTYYQHWINSFSEPSGKTLFGFYTDSTYSTKADTYNMTISGNITYYAKYTDTCNVSYELNGGSLSNTGIRKLTNIAKGSSFFLYQYNNSDRLNYFNTEVILSYDFNPTRQGYTFGGWYLDSTFTTQVPIGTVGSNEGDIPTCATPYQVNGDITLYAKWIQN